jgi:hypothetical protein
MPTPCSGASSPRIDARTNAHESDVRRLAQLGPSAIRAFNIQSCLTAERAGAYRVSCATIRQPAGYALHFTFQTRWPMPLA